MDDEALSARLVDAASELMWEAGGPRFTVAQVVARSDTSLKSFYRVFSGKDDLLVALFRADAQRGAAALEGMVDAESDPTLRLRAAVVGLFGLLSMDSRLTYASALVSEHLRLAESHPEQLISVLAPFVSVFENELVRAEASGVTRAGDPAKEARILFHLVTSHLHALVCHQIDEAPAEVADHLWAFCWAALRADQRPALRPTAERTRA